MGLKISRFIGTAGVRTWCGPSALSILTGRTLGYCAKLCAEQANHLRYLRRKHTQKTIKGVNEIEMGRALGEMGFTMKRVDFNEYKGKTLFRFMGEANTKRWRQALLINVTNHWVVSQMGQVYDNHCTVGDDYRVFWCRRRQVEYVWVVERKKRRPQSTVRVIGES